MKRHRPDGDRTRLWRKADDGEAAAAMQDNRPVDDGEAAAAMQDYRPVDDGEAAASRSMQEDDRPDLPSTLQFSNLSFVDWSGTSLRNTLVDIECSAAAPCPNMRFKNFNVVPPAGTTAAYKCVNVMSESGLDGCATTGVA
ncbi:hypothetical protein C8Q80DRAFT_1275886 [Daedaleopsis nitida]|nr:hypothetical protein C8Q80DRAFT_1275886 [Daedaleopsis nitida]